MSAAPAPHHAIPPAICDNCGETPAAPDHADYLSTPGMVRYVWVCGNCGHQFTTECAASFGPEAEQEAVKAFWPSLLVG